MAISLEIIQKAQEEMGKLEQLKGLFGSSQSAVPFEIGKIYFIQTLNYHALIEVKQVVGKFVQGRYTWIADSGRLSDFLNDGVLSSSAEVEPITAPGGINIDSIVTYFVWTHKFLIDRK